MIDDQVQSREQHQSKQSRRMRMNQEGYIFLLSTCKLVRKRPLFNSFHIEIFAPFPVIILVLITYQQNQQFYRKFYRRSNKIR